MLRIFHKGLAPGLIVWYDLSNEKEIGNSILGMLGACIGQDGY